MELKQIWGHKLSIDKKIRDAQQEKQEFEYDVVNDFIEQKQLHFLNVNWNVVKREANR